LAEPENISRASPAADSLILEESDDLVIFVLSDIPFPRIQKVCDQCVCEQYSPVSRWLSQESNKLSCERAIGRKCHVLGWPACNNGICTLK
jgi:hypothetical protein